MKYIKLFSTSAEYEAFIAGDQFVTPNISFIPTENLAKYSSIPTPTVIENRLTYGQRSRAETEWLIYAEYPVESDLTITATYEHPRNGTQTHNYTMSKGNTQTNESFSAMVEYTNIVVSPQQDDKYIYIV